MPTPSAVDCARHLATLEPGVLDAYRARLAALDSPLVADALIWEQAAAGARSVLAKVVATLANHELSPGVQIRASSDEIRAVTHMAETRGRAGVAPAHSVRAADVLFELVSQAVAAAVHETGGNVPDHHDAAVVALAHALNDRLEAGVDGYDAFLLAHVKRLHDDERRTLAREVHDRIGNTLSLVMRRLELAAATDGRSDLDDICGLMSSAIVEVGELVGELRRDDDFQGLHLALDAMVESLGPDRPVITVAVTGSESWAESTQVEAVFLVVREAVRNALAHSRAAHVAISVDINPVEIRASVVDDGVGLSSGVTSGPGHGHGVPSMRERVTAANGVFDLGNAAHGGVAMTVRVPSRADARPDRVSGASRTVEVR